MNTNDILTLSLSPYRRRARPLRAFSSSLAPRVHAPGIREDARARSAPSSEVPAPRAVSGPWRVTPP